jgi:hypothetical protein
VEGILAEAAALADDVPQLIEDVTLGPQSPVKKTVLGRPSQQVADAVAPSLGSVLERRASPYQDPERVPPLPLPLSLSLPPAALALLGATLRTLKGAVTLYGPGRAR